MVGRSVGGVVTGDGRDTGADRDHHFGTQTAARQRSVALQSRASLATHRRHQQRNNCTAAAASSSLAPAHKKPAKTLADASSDDSDLDSSSVDRTPKSSGRSGRQKPVFVRRASFACLLNATSVQAAHSQDAAHDVQVSVSEQRPVARGGCV